MNEILEKAALINAMIGKSSPDWEETLEMKYSDFEESTKPDIDGYVLLKDKNLKVKLGIASDIDGDEDLINGTVKEACFSIDGNEYLPYTHFTEEYMKRKLEEGELMKEGEKKAKEIEKAIKKEEKEAEKDLKALKKEYEVKADADVPSAVTEEMFLNPDQFDKALKVVQAAQKSIKECHHDLLAIRGELDEARQAKMDEILGKLQSMEHSFLDGISNPICGKFEPAMSENMEAPVMEAPAVEEINLDVPSMEEDMMVESATMVKATQEAVGSPLEDALNTVRDSIHAVTNLMCKPENTEFMNSPKGRKIVDVFKKVRDADNELAELL